MKFCFKNCRTVIAGFLATAGIVVSGLAFDLRVAGPQLSAQPRGVVAIQPENIAQLSPSRDQGTGSTTEKKPKQGWMSWMGTWAKRAGLGYVAFKGLQFVDQYTWAPHRQAARAAVEAERAAMERFLIRTTGRGMSVFEDEAGEWAYQAWKTEVAQNPYLDPDTPHRRRPLHKKVLPDSGVCRELFNRVHGDGMQISAELGIGSFVGAGQDDAVRRYEQAGGSFTLWNKWHQRALEVGPELTLEQLARGLESLSNNAYRYRVGIYDALSGEMAFPYSYHGHATALYETPKEQYRKYFAITDQNAINKQLKEDSRIQDILDQHPHAYIVIQRNLNGEAAGNVLDRLA